MIILIERPKMNDRRTKPIICITASINPENLQEQLLKRSYVTAVEKAGGVPVILPYCNKSIMDYYIRISDGILFSGGGDIDPVIFGETKLKECKTPIKIRDDFDLGLFKKAFDTDIPIMAICRGVQVANVAMGGDLWQDLPSQTDIKHTHYQKDARDVTTHYVKVNKGSLLYEITGSSKISVNSFHHQAVRNPAPGAVITARSDDGIPECLEFPGRKAFFLGLQWHPENLCKMDVHLDLFKAFVNEAKKFGREK